MDFDELFVRATGQRPYPYQREVALCSVLPEALEAPTGAGKTAAAALGWLYRRRFAAPDIRAATPRRLLFCLPMRTLVSQTYREIEKWLKELGLLECGAGLRRGKGVKVHLLLGGDAHLFEDDWHLHPERDAVLVGTQDMLLSRALMRGYGSSRFLWPWHHALLSNDCLWIFDEIQLMGAGLCTGLQLAAMRQRFWTFGPVASLFMSATLARDWLRTVDHPEPGTLLTLSDQDLASEELRKRRMAVKRLSRAQSVIDRAARDYAPVLAAEIAAAHKPGSHTLVVLNTVDRAVGVFEALEKLAAKKQMVPVVLLHSRFRPPDRELLLGQALARDFSGIIVSTQVVEAGVDLSARTVFTELAPWASLVQRAGRCNRRGEFDDARVLWIDHAEEAPAAPYQEEELREASKQLADIEGRGESFNPETIAAAGVTLPPPDVQHVLRCKDVLDLFDTTPDLGGVDIDVSRFIREGEERDAQVFWRQVEDAPGEEEPRPLRHELCAVPIKELREFLSSGRRAFRWDPLERRWKAVDRVVPGVLYLLRAADGGYLPDRGFSARYQAPVVVLLPEKEQPARPGPEEAMGDDPQSELQLCVPLRTHALDTLQAAREIVSDLPLSKDLAQVVLRAAQAHDLGKAHAVFQKTMRMGCPGAHPDELLAKSGGRARHERTGFRHELASALGWLQWGPTQDRDLIAYLLAAHHGKVRLSLRALPQDAEPGDGRLHARGVFDGDELPAVDLSEGVQLPALTLSLRPMQLGRQAGQEDDRSWAERVLGLLELFGPFRLSYLEALVRAADVRASQRENEP